VSHLAGYADPTKTAIGKKACRVDKCSAAQNIAETCKNIGTNLTQSRSPPVLSLSVNSMWQKENAATSAKVNGAESCEPIKNSLNIFMPDRESRHPIIATHWGLAA
jgi:hypothetical protein